MMIIKYI